MRPPRAPASRTAAAAAAAASKRNAPRSHKPARPGDTKRRGRGRTPTPPRPPAPSAQWQAAPRGRRSRGAEQRQSAAAGLPSAAGGAGRGGCGPPGLRRGSLPLPAPPRRGRGDGRVPPTCSPSLSALPEGKSRRLLPQPVGCPPHWRAAAAAAAAHGRPAAPPPRCLPSPSGEARPAPLGGKEGGKAGFIPLRRRPAGVGALRRPRRPLRSPSRREPRLRLRPGSEARFVPVSPQDRSLTLVLRPDKCLAPSFTTKNREALRETNQTPAVPRHSSAGNSLPSFPRP